MEKGRYHHPDTIGDGEVEVTSLNTIYSLVPQIKACGLEFGWSWDGGHSGIRASGRSFAAGFRGVLLFARLIALQVILLEALHLLRSFHSLFQSPMRHNRVRVRLG